MSIGRLKARILSHGGEGVTVLDTLPLVFNLFGGVVVFSLALSIQQLAVVGELLVNRALDNVDPQGIGVRYLQVHTVPEPTLSPHKIS